MFLCQLEPELQSFLGFAIGTGGHFEFSLIKNSAQGCGSCTRLKIDQEDLLYQEMQ